MQFERREASNRILREKVRAELQLAPKCDDEVSVGPDGLHRLTLGPSGCLTQKQIDAYHRDGYLIVKGLLAPDKLASLQDECWACWSETKGTGPLPAMDGS